MDPVQTIELARAAMMLVLTIVGPMLLASLIVGVAIGLFQALTHVQEVTLTFVPKILAIGVVMLLWLPMIGQAMSAFMARVSDLIIVG
jgi:flagellar biosynthetic protein FliQ